MEGFSLDGQIIIWVIIIMGVHVILSSLPIVSCTSVISLLV